MRIVTVAGYIVIVGSMVTLELIAKRRPDRVAPLRDMLADVMTSRTARVGIIAAWWWFGWHFLFA
ncbi:MAG TPA: DUF6186 family protein [Cryobacterium sp.]|nr:DUF6186 family protein [Cryobacterium sp.]